MHLNIAFAFAAVLALFVMAPGAGAAQDALETAAQPMTASQEALQAASRGDVEGALQIFTDAAASGDFEAQLALAWQYSGASDALLVAPDFPRALSWMRKAVAQKDKAVAAKLEQQILRAAIAFHDGVLPRADAVILFDQTQHPIQRKKNAAEAIKWLEIAAELGSVKAMTSIGNIYADETGAEKDFAAAAHWYEKIADKNARAELWLGKYNLQEKNLRAAMFWLDRYYIDEEEKKSHETEYDKTMHYFYAALLPDAPAGATSAGIYHALTQTPVSKAHFAPDDIIYPVFFLREYRHAATGKDFVIRIQLNNFDLAAKMKREFDRGRANIKINGHDAISAADTERGGELIVIAPFRTHIVVNAEMMDGKSGDATDVEILKSALRATDIDGLIAAADGHGYYKKDKNGNLYKLK